MAYELFLFDLDDTLLDFGESERLSFFLTMQSLGLTDNLQDLYRTYQTENKALWKLFEENKTTKDFLKVERFRKTFSQHGLEANAEKASTTYLETLPETVVLVDYAEEICRFLVNIGEIGIITNGIQSVQTKRIKNSKIAPYISFISVSEDCGFAKPDARFFEYSSKKAKNFEHAASIIIGDRLEADIQGALNFGIDSCWFNPKSLPRPQELKPNYEISHLSELELIVKKRRVTKF